MADANSTPAEAGAAPAKPKNPRFVKGSPEAKAWAGEMLERRLAKLRAQPATATKPPAPAASPSAGGPVHGSAPSGPVAPAPVKVTWFNAIGLGDLFRLGKKA